MSLNLSKEQIDDLLDYIDTYNPNYWKDDEKLVCCPVHGESNPSMGVSCEKQICHCFSCGFSGDFAKLLVYSMPEEFGLEQNNEGKSFYRAYRKAKEFLVLRYELEYRELNIRYGKRIKRYEQTKNTINVGEIKTIPYYKLAPFNSGKETYGYFIRRGFNLHDMKKFMVGRDLENKTVTLPVFYEDGSLAGIIGRYIDKNRRKNQRYKIYDSFERSRLLYPLNLSKPKDGEIILVEGQFDVIKMHSLGYYNTYAIMTDNLSKEQGRWILNNCSSVIWIGDNDERGLIAREKARKELKDFLTFRTVRYPKHGKDVCDWGEEEINDMVQKASSTLIGSIKRI